MSSEERATRRLGTFLVLLFALWSRAAEGRVQAQAFSASTCLGTPVVVVPQGTLAPSDRGDEAVWAGLELPGRYRQVLAASAGRKKALSRRRHRRTQRRQSGETLPTSPTRQRLHKTARIAWGRWRKARSAADHPKSTPSMCAMSPRTVAVTGNSGYSSRLLPLKRGW
jgi:hypothetical protein